MYMMDCNVYKFSRLVKSGELLLIECRQYNVKHFLLGTTQVMFTRIMISNIVLLKRKL